MTHDIRRSSDGFFMPSLATILSLGLENDNMSFSCQSVGKIQGCNRHRCKNGLVHNYVLEMRPLTYYCCDNVIAIYLSSNHVNHQRTKRVEIHLHCYKTLSFVEFEFLMFPKHINFQIDSIKFYLTIVLRVQVHSCKQLQ